MTRVYASIFIDQSVETVFEFVTTAANWPRWHIPTLNVSGAIDHPAEVGDEIVGQVKVMGQHDRFSWTVCEHKPPERWGFEGVGEGGARAKITYTLTPQNFGTFFERELVYTMNNPFTQFLDRLFLRNKMSDIAHHSLQRLKTILENFEYLD